MSVRDYNRNIVVSDCMTGEIITVIDKTLYPRNVILAMITSIIDNDYENENGVMIKYGYKN